MRTRQQVGISVGLVGLAFLVMASGPEICSVTPAETAKATISSATAVRGADYGLLAESIFSQGCMGSQAGRYGCMCPMLFAPEFEGSFTLTPNWHAPQGHRLYDVTVQGWLVTFDEEMVVAGTGHYDRWTDLQGNRWQSMTLVLDIYDEEVVLYSGAVEDALPVGEYPTDINIGLESDTDCFGYLIVLDAERLPEVKAIKAAVTTDDLAAVPARARVGD